MAEQSLPTPKKLHYGWTVVAVSFVAMLVAAGTRAAPSVLMVPWETEFGWSRATISFAIAVQLMIFGIVGPFSRLTIDDYRRQFETNVFGLLRTLYAGLSEIQKSRGHLVLIGSVAGGVEEVGHDVVAVGICHEAQSGFSGSCP